MAKATHSFRSGKKQARMVAAELAEHGTSRHIARRSAERHKVQGVGTERGLKQSLAQFADWLHKERRGDLWTCSRQSMVDYLEQRAEVVRQSALNMDRQHLDRLHRHLHGAQVERLPRIRSELATLYTTRAYTSEQLSAIRAAQGARNSITTELAERCGIRAHEAATILPASEQPRSGHREWSGDRFIGAGGVRPDGALYTVRGKGGLVREVWVPSDLVERLEARRYAEPVLCTDRGIHYTKAYNIGSGQAWSQSFSGASKRALGWSHGAHGTRHTYVQTRLAELQRAGWNYREARHIVSQEAGHFRESIIDAYLR